MRLAATMVLITTLIASLSLLPNVYAQEDPVQEIDHTQNSILGYHPITVAVVITVLGVSIRIFMGVMKRRVPGQKTKIDPMQITGSFIIGAFASLPIVGNAISHIPYDMADLNLFMLLAGTVGTVYGIDSGLKAGRQRLADKLGTENPILKEDPPATVATDAIVEVDSDEVTTPPLPKHRGAGA